MTGRRQLNNKALIFSDYAFPTKLSMQEKTDQELLQEFLAPSISQPGLVVTDFDAPIPDAVNIPFPPQLNNNWRVNDDDCLSEYSNISQQPFDNFVQAGGNYHSPSTPFLSVPGPSQRGRSPSITSNYSYSSVGIDSIEINSDWGEIQPFPGAQIVNVPPNWIGTINSPTNSVLSDSQSPLMAFGQERNLENAFEPKAEQYLDFNDFLQNHNSGYNSSEMVHGETMQGNELQMKHAPSLDSIYTLNNNQEPGNEAASKKGEDPYRPTTVPDGRFWKVVKNNGQTLYQCPYPDCEKSKIVMPKTSIH